MIKQIYLVRGSNKETYSSFTERIKSSIYSLKSIDDVIKLSYTITAEAPPLVSIIPFKKNKIAAITVVKSNNDIVRTIENMDGFSGYYSVTEALPVSYNKNWPDGHRTPGICLLTLFRKKKAIDYDIFINRWHNSHTPLSLKIHPLWHYNRNVIDNRSPNRAEPWDGIVEEHMRTRSELLNPFRFFGNPLVIIPRMIQVYIDTKSFLDYGTIEPYLVEEYHVISS